ncbi:MAG: ATP-binding protein [bacterium]|jgi:PAS domain S-box-containing protein|nr:ATP-binding protein [bacterium]MDD4152994.1 ATP-binding protein [bacterium]MDD4558197.1 ATP-binding protein [bacterium]
MHYNNTDKKRPQLSAEENSSPLPVSFNDIFANSLDAIFINELEEDGLPGKFVYVNNIFCWRSGYTREELLSMSPLELMDQEMQTTASALARELMLNGRILFEAPYIAKDGCKLISETGTHRFKFGNKDMMLSIIRDISGRRQNEERMLHAIKMETVCRLAGGIAHEFNNILMGISGYSQLALRHLKDNTSLKRDLELISELADRAAELTRQLLTFAGRQPIDPSNADVNEIVSEAADMLEHITISQDAELILTLTAETEKICIDQNQIKQVLLNIVINACDAMLAGGTITLKTSEAIIAPETQVPVTGLKPGRYVQISITDTGCGMDEEIRQHIFEPFFTTRACGEGTGLGLSTAHSIIEQHKGGIGVTSKPGKGTTLDIYLPRSV